jgi:ABC-type transport system involved in multi-copper enzyme maturation permease subunit
MKRDPFISFLAGLAVSIAIVGIIYLCFFLLIFDLGGGETLSQVEHQNMAVWFLSVLLFAIAAIYARRYIRNNRKYTGIGIAIVPFMVTVTATVYLFGANFYHTKFDKATWAQSKPKPDKMAKTLVKEKTLIGLTRMQVKQMLGEGAEEYGDKNTDRGSIIYHVENNWTFSVIFRYDKVIDTQLRLPWLGI